MDATRRQAVADMLANEMQRRGESRLTTAARLTVRETVDLLDEWEAINWTARPDLDKRVENDPPETR